MKIRLTEDGGQFGGARTVEIDGSGVALSGGVPDLRVEVAGDLLDQLVEAVQHVLSIADPVAERLGDAVDGTTTTLDLEQGAQHSTIHMTSADEPSAPLWKLLELIDEAAVPASTDQARNS